MSEEFIKIEQSQQAKRMNLAEWRASRVKELDLPSGLLIKLRDVTITDLMLTGNLPPAFTSFIEETQSAGKQQIDIKDIMSNMKEFAPVLDIMLEAALVEPKIGSIQDDEHITIDEVSYNDKMFIFQWLNREVSQVNTFRKEEDKPVASVQHGDSVREET